MLPQKNNNTKLRNNNTGSETMLIFKVNKTLLWDSAFIKTKIVFRNFIPRQLVTTQGFPYLTNEIEGKHATQT